MSRNNLLVILGLLIIISPFVGLPLAILTWILPVLGALVLGIGFSYTAHRQSAKRVQQQNAHVPELPNQF